MAYRHIGQGLPVLVDYASISIGLDAIRGSDGSSTAGAYPGFDQYRRRIWHAWVHDNFAPGTNPGQPNATPLIARRYEYDAMSCRTFDWDGRPGAVAGDRDWGYVYDMLDRLQTASRGLRDDEKNPTSIGTIAADSRQWDLDMLGNWDAVITDLDGDWLFETGNETEDRDHNSANELTSRDGPAGSGITFSPTHDATGNFLNNNPSSGTELEYTHDAWNRLVQVERVLTSGARTVVLKNTYNGLNWRVTREADTSKAAYNGVDEKRVYYYSKDWQMLEEHVDTDLTDQNDRDYVSQQVWGTRYIDDAVAKRIDRNDDGDWDDLDSEFYYLTDAMFSVRAVTNDAGQVRERIDYTPYGVAKHRYAADLNADGSVDSTDSSILATNLNSGVGLSPGDTGYDPDVDGDGIDTTDQGAYSSVAKNQGSNIVPDGWITDPTDSGWIDNCVGFDGYHFDIAGASDASARGVYSIRNRVYDPGAGRWPNRDPLGYIGGATTYEYSRSTPVSLADAWGLNPERIRTTSYSQCSPWENKSSARRHSGLELYVSKITRIHIPIIGPRGGRPFVGPSGRPFANNRPGSGEIDLTFSDDQWVHSSEGGNCGTSGGGSCRTKYTISLDCSRRCECVSYTITDFDTNGDRVATNKIAPSPGVQRCATQWNIYLYGTTSYSPSIGGAPFKCNMKQDINALMEQAILKKSFCDEMCGSNETVREVFNPGSGANPPRWTPWPGM